MTKHTAARTSAARTSAARLRAADYDFAATVTLQAGLHVSEYMGNGRSAARLIRPGARVTVTWYRGGVSCSVRAVRPDNTEIDRDFAAPPAAVLAAAGISVTGA